MGYLIGSQGTSSGNYNTGCGETSKHKSMFCNIGRPGGRSNLWPSIEKQCRDKKNSMTQLHVVNQQPPPSGNTLYTFTIKVSQNFRNKFTEVSEIIKSKLDHSRVHAVLTNLKIQSNIRIVECQDKLAESRRSWLEIEVN